MGKEVEMVFLTNNLEWSADSIVELYRCRWQIEVFFKQIKQTLAVGRLSGHQRQRRALAGVDGAAGLSAAALSGVLSRTGLIASVGSSPSCELRCGRNGMR